MKAAHPREIIKRTAQSAETFVGQEVVMRLSSGGVYRGKWLNCEASTCQVTLRDDATGSVVWLDASHLESITFPGASDDMLTILSDHTFDPFTRSEKVGDLILSRQIGSCSEELSSILGQTVQVTFEGIEGGEGSLDNLARVVLLDVAKQLTMVLKKLCSDEFSKNEIKKNVEAVRLTPADQGTAKLDNKTMKIQFAWKNPKDRWNERSLTEALNNAL